MTRSEFRKLALSLPETVEQSHFDHPDFRAGGKIFATLDYPGKGWGMVALSPADQHLFVIADPKTFVPAKGAWGAKGATGVMLRTASKKRLQEALWAAWRVRAPKSLVKRHAGT